ncbi:HNH endonuclease [Tomitella gaofuii]|uniref:HNH endonuclease n=1 Tax=Tomitella gaofuii TaxID=2760083 RepID=UPI0015FA5A84|nr:HNH endonuclease [Tomitella gaofuii]
MTESRNNTRSAPGVRRASGARGEDACRGESGLARRVLVLNASWEPLGAVGFQRAVVMVVCGKAELVAPTDDGRLLHSERLVVPFPSVIQLAVYVHVPYQARSPLTRAGLMARDGRRCVYCGGRADTIDHVVPRSRGGGHSWENCVASCGACNRKKADRLLEEIGWRLPRPPTPPRGRHWRVLSEVPDPDPQWLPYLGQGAA